MSKYWKIAVIVTALIVAVVVFTFFVPSPYYIIGSIVVGAVAGRCAGNIRDGKW